MNIVMTERGVAAAQPLKDKVSLVTGSTSGIVLGIARALAAGLGGRPQRLWQARGDRSTQSAIGSDFGVPAPIPPPTCQSPIDRRDGQDDAREVRQPRHSREQCRHPARRAPAGVSGRQMGRHHRHQSQLGIPYDASCPTEHDRQEWGRIINIASAHGLVGSAFKSAYVAAKHGMLGLTKVTALETAELGITCNAICPGYVSSPLVEAQMDGQAKAHGIPRAQVIREVLLAQQPTSASPRPNWRHSRAFAQTLRHRSPGPRSQSMAA